jgi:probable O-glycosylation ligase (exosortase A-associated)
MRDLIVTLAVLGSLPLIFLRPWVGVLVWVWISFMNPHMLAWGFARSLPWVLIVAVVTLVTYFASNDRKSIPITSITIVWLTYFAWTFVTLLFALNSEGAWEEWDRWWRIQVMVLLVLMAIHQRERLDALVWVVALSIGFYGVKGGIFTILTGGQYMVGGPPGGFIAGNNEIALALLMVLPLFWYLKGRVDNLWARRALLASMGLCALAILATYSRGALLGLATMGFVLWLRTRNRFVTGTAIALLALTIFAFLPERWHERMGTISTYQQDESALGRINAWYFAFNLAVDRPIGGGFRVFTPELFMEYAPEPRNFHDAHSIYFEVLGEQGWPGLILFLTLGMLVVVHTQRTVSRYRGHPTQAWASELAAMLQVGFIGYAACGAFLGLSYFDLPYVLMAMAVLTRMIADRGALENVAPAPAQAAAPAKRVNPYGSVGPRPRGAGGPSSTV